ncbi:MAG: hypothetical protein HZB76_02085 [Chlamydiae bacterium]|nr:hypothetical protein [Chlamydiota bacterium]
MKENETTGKDKIQKICDILKKETIDPAKQEAKEIIENANMQALEIINISKRDAAKLIEEAKKTQEEEKKIFKASLDLAAKKGIDAFVMAIGKEGIDSDLTASVAKEINPKDVIHLLVSQAAKKLTEKDIVLSDIAGGVKVKIKDMQLTLDVSAEAIKDLLAGYIRKDFQDIIFKV